MKVIIELNEDVLIESVSIETDLRICFKTQGIISSCAIVSIDDLKLAIRKLTAK